jgi:hypothetical protein
MIRVLRVDSRLPRALPNLSAEIAIFAENQAICLWLNADG